ncbi:MAG: aspartate aminotransferase family protein [Planctomyces sp.]|nr:aspartate aminotransferase family protein [Planctomyces sp.]
MSAAISFPGEARANRDRETIAADEPLAQRTYTPSQAVFARSWGVFHETPDGRRLYDFSSGVLVANLGHNPPRWMRRFADCLGWSQALLFGTDDIAGERLAAIPLTAYNAVTPVEAEAVRRLLANLRQSPLGRRLDSVLWAASGSEAVQKALWACLHRDESRDIILATRFGFHGKKGLAGAVTGSESDRDRDPRVKFVGFPRSECDDLSEAGRTFDAGPYARELDALWREFGPRINCLITEPYLGGGGSYHPPAEYHHLLQDWCRAHDVLLIFDEVQSNFGRTGSMYAFEKYGVEPDFVCLGKGLGNGVPVSAAAGRSDVMASLSYGEGSDTWSANPMGCAAVLATLDEFESTNVLEHTRELSRVFAAALGRLKQTGVIVRVRGEGLVFGIECGPVGEHSARDVAIEVVRQCYLGRDGGDGIHLLGPLAGTVLRISPPMTMTFDEADHALALLQELIARVPAALARSAPAASPA